MSEELLENELSESNGLSSNDEGEINTSEEENEARGRRR